MASTTRRAFLLSSAALAVGCAIRRTALDAQPEPATRQPALGQTWRYAKLDVFSRKQVDTQIDTVAAVGASVTINSTSEAGPATNASHGWGSELLRKFTARDRTAHTVLPGEIQQPWGMILVDSHWSQIQVYERPLPLWPTRLQPGWRTIINAKYKTPGNEDGLPWQLTMDAEDWETIAVPAGQFKALRFSNLINFTDSEGGRKDSIRHEKIWVAPEIGRWVVRQSTGTYYLSDSTADQRFDESGYRWELEGYT